MSQDAPSPPPSIVGTSGYPTDSRAAAAARCELLSKAVPARPLVNSIEIPSRTGRAVRVAQGQVVRVRCHQGPQVADLIAFNADDTREKFWQARTRIVHGGHLCVGDQLWSIPPWTRPMMTMITDTVEHGELADGARSHDLLFCRCDARLYELVHKRTDTHANCNDNLAGAIAPFGLGAGDVHDPFNIFMTTGLNRSGKPFYLPSDAKKGDYVDVLAEMNVLVAISACPGGSSGQQSYPLMVDIFGRD
ncbi:MAG TPA: urea carboxylase-associated family protein [Stellaceae bacterium]|nr:urea carboxylase-associated family protein [Stellaceae bacterium]